MRVVVVDREDGLAVDAHADAGVRGDGVHRATALDEVGLRPAAGGGVEDALVLGRARARVVGDAEGVVEQVEPRRVEGGHSSALVRSATGRKRNIIQIRGENGGLARGADDQPFVVAVRVLDSGPRNYFGKEVARTHAGSLLRAGAVAAS